MRYVSMHIYAAQEPVSEMEMYHCSKCKRVIFKVNSSHMLVSNAYGISFKDVQPGEHYIEIQCHSCKTVHSILFQ
jgi:phage FluMu protein Com